jgi:tRNA A-37 threonylcarbamoyl transferase component Bud32/tetratricopeptide (TPR) repeat protein
MPSLLERLRDGMPPNLSVERELASGGMGTVFLGRDLALDRRVAIKILRPELFTAVAAERFVREAQYLAGLNHPNIVAVHLAGQASGLAYYVMDFVDGDTLDARLSQGPLPLPQVIKLGKDLLGALAAAHGKGIIHRDIKPANIFLVEGRALLGDFGIARGLDDAADALTRPGQIIGTLAYMAPEQLSGSTVTAQTDLYAVGLVLYQACTGRRWEPLTNPEEANWKDVPPSLSAVLETALQPAPADRWESARSFSQALTRGRSHLHAARLRPLIPLAALGLFAGVYWLRPESKPQSSNVALYPFEVAGLSDTALGTQLARLTASYLEALPGVTVAPVRTTFQSWRASSLPPGERLARLTGGPTGAEYGVWGVVRPAQGGVEVQLKAVNARGEPVLETAIRGDPTDRSGLGDSLALQIVRKVFPRSQRLYRSAGALAGVSPAAISEFLFGEDAAERDAWLTAERHYLNAFALDSTFVLAAWRLANARRWMPLRSSAQLPPGFLDLYRAHGDGLSPVDRLLIDAQFAPGGAERFALYEEAVRRAPRDAYPSLFYGDELFHRGPLAGRPRDHAIRMLQHAVELDSTLAPAHEHLAWALIRSGRRDEARRSLDALSRVAGSPEESEIYLPALLEIAFTMRFTPEAAAQQQAALQSPFVLGLAARGALSFDMPAVQSALGARLAGLPSAKAALLGSGEVSQGVALMAMGRPARALAHFDRAARLLQHGDEARLQAAEWRVLPSALGLPGIPPDEVERGRRELRSISGDSTLGYRAAWALAFDALRQGDTSTAQLWMSRVVSRADSTNPLALHLRAVEYSVAGRFHEALDLSRPALAYDSAGRAGDPFFRAALHLQRGEWYASVGQAQAADADWLWYENLDAVGWPSTVAQACEVDWALGTYARWRRARLSDSTGGRNEACRGMTEVTELWAGAEPAYKPWLTEARGLLERCRR